MLLDLGHESEIEDLPNDRVRVGVVQRLEGVTGAMFEWWFGYMAGFEHYQRWHPVDHLAFEWVEGWEPGRYVGATHLTHETLGGGPLIRAHITFRPRALWLDWRQFAENRIGGVIAATIGLLDDEGTPHHAGDVLHVCGDDGRGSCELRTSFFIDRAGGAFTDEHAQGLSRHCNEEMQYLAGFLPGLYAEHAGGSR